MDFRPKSQLLNTNAMSPSRGRRVLARLVGFTSVLLLLSSTAFAESPTPIEERRPRHIGVSLGVASSVYMISYFASERSVFTTVQRDAVRLGVAAGVGMLAGFANRLADGELNAAQFATTFLWDAIGSITGLAAGWVVVHLITPLVVVITLGLGRESNAWFERPDPPRASSLEPSQDEVGWRFSDDPATAAAEAR